MPNITPNYKLEKPTPEEFYDVSVPNTNMDKIDAALKTLSDALGGIDLTTLSEAINAVDKKVTAHSEDDTKHLKTGERDKLNDALPTSTPKNITQDPNEPTSATIMTKHPNNPNAENYWYVLTFKHAQNRTQIATRYDSVSDMAVRHKYNDAWTTWVKLSDKAPINNPNFSGRPTAPTAAVSSNDSQIANTAFVQGIASNIISTVNTTAVKDNRAEECPPSFYRLNPRKVHWEMKSNTVLGIPDMGTQVIDVCTIAGWSNASGGATVLKQLAYPSNGTVMYRQSRLVNSVEEWAVWVQMETTAGAQAKVDVSRAETAELRAEFEAFKAALTEGFTNNQFSDGLSSLDAFNVTAGYYNLPMTRLEV